MKLIFASLLASLGTTASASIYHYKYHGQEMKLIQEPDYEFWKTEPFGPLPIAEKTSMAIQIDIWINTALMPGGVLGDFSFILDFAEPAPDYMWVTGNYGFDKWHTTPPTFRYASFKFDAAANITHWDIGVGSDYPQQGPNATTAFDHYEYYYGDLYAWETEQPGYWERLDTSAPTPVPLPAGGWLLLGGLGGLAFGRRLLLRIVRKR